MTKYKELPSQVNFPALEREILKFWEENKIFEKSIESRDPNRRFVFYEGPPTANGRPGIHHVISRTIKDYVCRWKTMQGYRVERKAGWDTHGLPVEIEVEKELGFTSKDQIEAYGVDRFNAKCRESVWRYKEEWDELTRRIAFWLDLEHPYITYTNEYIESVWWSLSELWKKGLVYQGHKIVPYCPRCQTPLSSHELSLGYDELDDPSVFVKMKVKGEADTYFLVWTTTPWTLISNVALAVHPEVDYAKIAVGDEKLILASKRLSVIDGDYQILDGFRGQHLLGLDYERLFDFLPVDKRGFYVIPGDFVTTEEGTGIVHIAPAFGEDDYQVGQKFDLPFLQPVDPRGQLTEEVTPWKGQFVKAADRGIIENLRERGLLYKAETYRHTYPFCWRCDSPLLYYARRSWYIRTTTYKERLLANNAKIAWYPREVGEGRFGEWLQNNVDWALSRDRYWGTPLPLWVCEACGRVDCIGSLAELKRRSGLTGELDLHKPYVDEVTLPCSSCQGTMRRTPEVIDVWYDSGSMPFAQWHYPFENRERFREQFPADFISEGVDQTRGWFYSLLAISTLLFDEPCYKACVSIELILDKYGQKMSKSRGNTVDPFIILDHEGADPLRWYLLTVSPPWLPTRFDVEGIRDVVGNFYRALVNTYAFFALYANIDGYLYADDAQRIPVKERAELDRWILSVLATLTGRIEQYLERYDVTRACRGISDFVVEDLSNWYVRRCRRRFWKSEMGPDKLAAYQTLYEVLLTVSKLMAPFSPFMAEELYRNLTAAQPGQPESVHLAFYPKQGEGLLDYIDEELEERMALGRRVVYLARALRNKTGLKVRQPLRRLFVHFAGERRRAMVRGLEQLIKDEINVKGIEYVESPEALVRKQARPIFKSLGPKFGHKAQAVAEQSRRLSPAEIARLESSGQLSLLVDGQEVTLRREDVEITAEQAPGLAVETEGDLTVALDTELTEDLLNEGLAREFVSRVQNMRKEAGYEVTDRIKISVQTTDRLKKALSLQADYIKNETLAEDLSFDSQRGQFEQRWDIEGEPAVIRIGRIGKSEGVGTHG